ncbi:MAG: hypothetical protein NVSMB57_03240 [Actinomycetota bacterium]
MAFNRRDFLRMGGISLLGLAATACTGGKDGSASTTHTSGSGSAGGKTLADLTKGAQQSLKAVVAQPLLGRPNERLSIGLLDTAEKDITGGTAKVWFAESQTSPVIGPIDLTYHGHGYTRSTYIGRITLPKKGQWLYFVEAKPTGGTTLTGGGTDQVGVRPGTQGQPPQPIPGDKAIVVATPTLTAARGVAPICTQKPRCSMHAVSLDTALNKRRPVVLVIGTPAFCQSRFCGPIVDELMLVGKGPLGKKADFIHIELYRDNKNAPATGVLAPAANAWHVEAEPVVYYIRPDGTIAEWTIGPSDSVEIAALTKRLLA